MLWKAFSGLSTSLSWINPSNLTMSYAMNYNETVRISIQFILQKYLPSSIQVSKCNFTRFTFMLNCSPRCTSSSELDESLFYRFSIFITPKTRINFFWVQWALTISSDIFLIDFFPFKFSSSPIGYIEMLFPLV